MWSLCALWNIRRNAMLASPWLRALYKQMYGKYLLNEHLNECYFVLFCFCSHCYWKNTFFFFFFKILLSPVKAILQGTSHPTCTSKSFPSPWIIKAIYWILFQPFLILSCSLITFCMCLFSIARLYVCALEDRIQATYTIHISFSIDKA